MLNELAKKIHQANCDKGFYDTPREMGTTLCLIHSEISEALEAHRHGRFCKDPSVLLEMQKEADFQAAYDGLVKGTFEEEVADAIIRLLDLSGLEKINIEAHVAAKLRYNANRPYKHGKKY